jgi:hypothetical protein
MGRLTRRREELAWKIFRCLGEAAARRVEEGETAMTETGVVTEMKVWERLGEREKERERERERERRREELAGRRD